MALQEKTSVHLGVPYIYLPDKKRILCSNGVLFSLEEYKKGIDINAEYERRAKEDRLYDYLYAKNTGVLRKKRTTAPVKASSEISQRKDNEIVFKPEVKEKPSTARFHTDSSVRFITALLLVTSLISMYVSTLHTATYLYDYVDIFSAWLMSASVTAYNSTAFEVSVIFKSKKRYGLTFVFITLWTMVTLFSMATTVSVFYDRFNFTETQIAEENKGFDSHKLSLELLQKKEKDLRESIDFKKKDIEYRQEREYATTAVRNELTRLEAELQRNLTEQQKILSEVPEVAETKVQRKESLFSFLGRLMHIEGGVLEFIMSTLSAIFVNLIAPFSLVAVSELLQKKELTR